MTIVNKSDYPTKDVRRLIRIVLSKLKKSFTLPAIGTIRVESYDSAQWEGHFDGGTDEIKVRLGRKVKYPANWDNIMFIPTWEDCFVGMFTWCVCLHYQKTSWIKKEAAEAFPEGRLFRVKRKVKYSRADCQEITSMMLKRWRVDSEMKMIFEKAGVLEL